MVEMIDQIVTYSCVDGSADVNVHMGTGVHDISLNDDAKVSLADADSLAVTVGTDIVSHHTVARVHQPDDSVYFGRACAKSQGIIILHARTGADIVFHDKVVGVACAGVNPYGLVISEIDAAILDDTVAVTDVESDARTVLDSQPIHGDAFLFQQDHAAHLGQEPASVLGMRQRSVRTKQSVMVAAVDDRLVSGIRFPDRIADVYVDLFLINGRADSHLIAGSYLADRLANCFPRIIGAAVAVRIIARLAIHIISCHFAPTLSLNPPVAEAGTIRFLICLPRPGTGSPHPQSRAIHHRYR